MEHSVLDHLLLVTEREALRCKIKADLAKTEKERREMRAKYRRLNERARDLRRMYDPKTKIETR